MAKSCGSSCSDEDCSSCGPAAHSHAHSNSHSSHSNRGVGGMESLPEELKKDLMMAQQTQQQMQLASMQKAQFSMQMAETDKALEELGTAKGTCYRFIGSVLVPKTKEELEKELKEEKEMLEVRLKALEKQEKMAKERLEELGKKFEKFQREMGGGQGEGAAIGAQ